MFGDVPLFSLLFLLKLAISLVGYPLWIALLNPPGLDHLSKAILICWQIWEARNNLLFQDSHPHPTCWIKINFDGPVINSQATTGFVIWNTDGHVLLVGANNIGENSINVAENVAFRMVLMLLLIEAGVKLW